jgi:hypothetical protein
MLPPEDARDAALILQAAAEGAALLGGVGCAALDWATLCGADCTAALLPAAATWLRGGGDVTVGVWEAPRALQRLAAAHATHRVLPVRVAALMARLERPATTLALLLDVLQCPLPAPVEDNAMAHDAPLPSAVRGGLGALAAEGVTVAAAQLAAARSTAARNVLLLTAFLTHPPTPQHRCLAPLLPRATATFLSTALVAWVTATPTGSALRPSRSSPFLQLSALQLGGAAGTGGAGHGGGAGATGSSHHAPTLAARWCRKAAARAGGDGAAAVRLAA